MTRDEAIKTFNKTRGQKHLAEGMIDIFEALGMLKLDKPMSAREVFKAKMFDLGYSAAGPVMQQALEAFDDATSHLHGPHI